MKLKINAINKSMGGLANAITSSWVIGKTQINPYNQLCNQHSVGRYVKAITSNRVISKIKKYNCHDQLSNFENGLNR